MPSKAFRVGMCGLLRMHSGQGMGRSECIQGWVGDISDYKQAQCGWSVWNSFRAGGGPAQNVFSGGGGPGATRSGGMVQFLKHSISLSVVHACCSRFHTTYIFQYSGELRDLKLGTTWYIPGWPGVAWDKWHRLSFKINPDTEAPEALVCRTWMLASKWFRTWGPMPCLK